MNRFWAISRLARPAAASWAARRSLGVSESSPLRTSRLAQQLDAALSALGEAGRAQGDSERARPVAGLGERDLFGRERSGFGSCAEREVRERRVGAPRRARGAADVQASQEVAGGEEVAEGHSGAKLGQPKPAPGREQPS